MALFGKKPRPVVRQKEAPAGAVEALEKMAGGQQAQPPPKKEVVDLGKLPEPVEKPASPATPKPKSTQVSSEFTADEARLIKAIVLVTVGNPDGALEVLKDVKDAPAITPNIAAHYMKVRDEYNAAKPKGPAEMANTKFMQARHQLSEATRDSPELHDRYFKRGDPATAMNSLLSERAKAAFGSLLSQKT